MNENTGATPTNPPEEEPTATPAGGPGSPTIETPRAAGPATTPEPVPADTTRPWTESGPAQPGAYGPQPGGYGPPPGGYGPPPGGAAAPESGARRLTRSRTDRMVGGVCGGLARYWNTDPVLLRVLTVVLVVFTGGAFIVAYLIALIVIPEEPLPGAAGGGQPATTGYAAGGTPPYGGSYAAPMPPAAPRERSYLGWLVLSIAVLVAGILGIVGFLVPATIQMWGLVGGVMVAILGLGLLVGARYGRARWLVIPAVPLALVTFGLVAAGNWVQQNPNWERWVDSPGSSSRPWGGITVGDRTWVVGPEDVAGSPLEFRLTMGEARLDLTGLTASPGAPPADPVRLAVDVGVGLGNLEVVVPDDMRLVLDAVVGAGAVDLPGLTRQDGTDLDVVTTIESRAGTPTHIVELDAAVGAGNLEVRREAA